MSFMSLIQNKMMSALSIRIFFFRLLTNWTGQSLFQIKHGWAILSHCKRIYVNRIMRTRGNETAENNSHIYFLARLTPQRSRTALISYCRKLNIHLLICSVAEPQTQLYKQLNKQQQHNNNKRKKEKKKRYVDISFQPRLSLAYFTSVFASFSRC